VLDKDWDLRDCNVRCKLCHKVKPWREVYDGCRVHPPVCPSCRGGGKE